MTHSYISIVDGEVRKQLAGVAARSIDATELMAGISSVLLTETEANFAAQGQPQWADLAPSTIRKRTRRGSWPGMILQESGQLAASVTPFSTATEAGIGTNKAYARIQQLGGTIEREGRTGTVRLRTTGKTGKLLRQGKEGKLANLAVFAKPSQTQAVARAFSHGPYNIHMPARPYLPVSASGELFPEAREAITRLVRSFAAFR